MERSKRAQGVLEVEMAQKTQVAKGVWEVRLQFEAEKILQVAREVAWLDMELKRAKFKARQVEEGSS